MQRLTELVLNEITARIETLSPMQAREVVAALSEKFGGEGAVDDEAKVLKPPTPVELSSQRSAAARSTNQLSEPTSLSADLPLGAGAELKFTSLSSEPSLESTMQMTEMSVRSRRKPVTSAATMPKSDVSAIVETKPIVDEAKDVTAIETPEIAATSEAIVDEAKEVTAIKTPTIASAAPPIVDQTPDVREIKAAKIVSTAKPIADRTAAPLAGIAVPSAQATGLRPSHVVQPTADLDGVIEAELIAVDGDDDAIMIVDEDFRMRR